MKNIRKDLERLVSPEQAQAIIEAMSGDKEKYQAFFKKAMKKFGVSSPDEFKDEAKKKEFFDYVDKNWKEDKED